MVGGCPKSDNKAISVQLNLTGTGTGTELGKTKLFSLEIVCIVFRSKVYMMHVRTSPGDRIPLRTL